MQGDFRPYYLKYTDLSDPNYENYFFDGSVSCPLSASYSFPVCINPRIRSKQTDEKKEDFLNVYPNPASQFLNVQNEKGDHIMIKNILGNVVKEQERNESIIDISKLSPGIYFIKDEFGFTLKFIKI